MDTNLNKELIIASENGSLETVKNCISKGADLNFIGPNSGALHCAAFNGHEEIVQTLLENGANPNILDKQMFYPLQLAVSCKNTNICKALIAHGADILVKTQKEGTLLHLAAANNFTYIFDIEEIAKIDLEAKDFEGKTALNVASSLGIYLMIGILLRKKSDINTRDNDGVSPLLNSIIYLDNKKISHWESIGEKEDVEVKYEIINGWMRLVEPYTGDINDPSTDLATWEQDEISEYSWGPDGLEEYLEAINCIELFLNRSNLDKDHIDNFGNSATIHACSVGEPEIIDTLFSKEFSFDIKNKEGIHPLHYLARSKRLDGLKLYLKKNKDANINVVDNNGWTAGHYLADQGGHPQMAKVLVENGLDLTIGSTKTFAIFTENTKAFEIADHWKDEELSALLKHS